MSNQSYKLVNRTVLTIDPDTNESKVGDLEQLEKIQNAMKWDYIANITYNLLNNKNFYIEESLGIPGSYGTVFRLSNSELKEDYALKLLNFDRKKIESKKEWYQLQRGEALAFQLKNHPGIVAAEMLIILHLPSHKVFMLDSKNSLEKLFHEAKDYIVLGLLSRFCEFSKDLYEAIYENHWITISEKKALEISLTIVDTLDHLHKNGIVYRDLKPENVLYHKNDKTFKLIDFGFSRYVHDHYPQRHMWNGTPEYMAPEICLKEYPLNECDKTSLYPEKEDSWALGAFIFELSNGHQPWPKENNDSQTVYDQLREYVKKCFQVTKDVEALEELTYKEKQELMIDRRIALIPWIKETSYSIRFLIASLLDPDPKTRLSIKQAKKRLETLSKGA